MELTLSEFRANHRAPKIIPQTILERWNERVIRNRWKGSSGAAQYMALHGNGIGATKVIDLAFCAEKHGDTEMATVFWEKAYRLTHHRPPVDPSKRANAVPGCVAVEIDL